MTKLPFPKTCFLMLFLLLSSWTIQSQVVINEFSAANRNFYYDNFGDNADWIELYNAGSSSVNLSGYHLSDNISRLTKWKIPNGIDIDAGDHLLIFATGRDQNTPGGLHAGFKLTQSRNEYIILSSPDSMILDAIQIVIPNQTNHSRGRVEDGSAEWGVFDFPTPGVSNNNALKEYAGKPIFETAPGFYPSAISVSILAEANSIIRYTTNGSEPNAFSAIYTNPINISSTTVIKAKVFSDDPEVPPSFTEVNTYFINENHTVPVISVSSSEVSGLLSGDDNGEHVTHIEYYNESDDFEFEMLGHFKGHGNDSWGLAQRGIRFYVKDYYGYANKIDYPLFPTSDRTDFDVFILKAGASDNYPRSDIQWGRPSCHLRDVYVQSLSDINDLNVDTRRYDRCVMYVNGDYWGVYEMRERMDSDYTNYYYDQEEEHVDMLEYWGGLDVRYGSANDWQSLYNFMLSNDLSVTSNFDYVASELDLSSLIDYVIVNTFVVNTDWLNWNTKWWRGTKGEGTKWRYTLWDMDNVFNLGQNYTGLPTTGWESDPCDVESIYDDAEANVGHIAMLVALFENDDFVQMYINRYADLASTVFTCESMLGYLDEMVTELQPEMQRQVDRWGGSMSEWEANLDFMRNEIQSKCTVIAEQVGDCYEDEGITGPYDLTIHVDPPLSGKVKVNTAIGTTYPWNATYFGGIEINLTALPENTWAFDHWEISNNFFGPNEFADAINMSLTSGDEITAFFISNCSAVPGLTGPTSICEGDTVMLSANTGFANYLWSDDSNESTLEITRGGIYRLTVTDNFGCENAAEILVEENLVPLIQLEGNTNVCEGENFEIDPGAGFGAYAWSNNTNTETLITNQPGTYSVTVTNENGCSSTESFVLETSSITPPTITGNLILPTNGTVDLDAGTGYTNYDWSNSENTQSIQISDPGIYEVTVTNENGCSSLTSVEVVNCVAPTPEILGSINLCEGSENTLSVNENFNAYQWSNAAITESIDITEGGLYSLTVTNAQGCEGVTNFMVNQTNELTPSIEGTMFFCAGNSTTLIAESGYSTYVWSNGIETPNITLSTAGNYDLTVTNENGCTGVTAFSITENNLNPPTFDGDQILCNNAIGQLTTTEIYATYQWSNAASSSTIAISNGGNYGLTVTDINDCSAANEINVQEVAALEPEITGELSFCNGFSTQVVAESGYQTYLWSNEISTPSNEITEAGIYTLTVTDANGCSGTSMIEVLVNEITPPFILGAESICTGTTSELSVNTNYSSYQWSDNSTLSNLIITEAGIYSLTVTDENGCRSTTSLEILENEIPNPVINGEESICFGSTIALSANDGFVDYQWSNLANSQSINITSGGIYTLTVTNADGCTAITDFNITEVEEVIPIIEGEFSFCNGFSTQVTTTNNYASYQWSNEINTATNEINEPGIYSLTVTDGNACSGIASFEISTINMATPTITGSQTICAGSASELTASNGYAAYQWSDNSEGQSITISSEGIYRLTVSDENGCTSTTSFEVTESDQLTPAISGGEGICLDGTTTLDAGTAFAEYLWTGGATTSSIEVDAPGTYSLTVSDENGCSGMTTLSLDYFETVTPEIFGASGICVNSSTTLTASANANYTEYKWSNNETTQAIEINTAGIYELTITDINGCQDATSFEVEAYEVEAPIINGAAAFCAGTENELDAGSGYASYLWSNGLTDQMILVENPGEYKVTVTNENGCTAQTSKTIEEWTITDPTILGSLNFCPGSATELSTSTSYTSYSWSNGEETATTNISVAGNYQLTVIDENGCESFVAFEVEENPFLEPIIDGEASICPNENILLSNSGGYDEYLWSDGTSGTSIEVNEPGIYSLRVSDDNGCTGLAFITVEEYEVASPAIIGSETICPGSTGTLSSDSDYTSYLWSNANMNSSIDINSAGTYGLTVTDVNGCQSTNSFTVAESESLSPVINGVTSICSGASAVLDAGNNYSEYIWSNGSLASTAEISEPGTYSLTVSDASGCSGETSIVVSENEISPPTILGSESICLGSTTELTVSESYANYAWSTNENSEAIIIDAAGVYTLMVTDANGCESMSIFTVIESESLSPTITGETEICDGTSTLLDAGNTYTEYLWSNGMTTSTISINESGIYNVTVSDENGCEGRTSFEVSEKAPIVPVVLGTTTICPGTSTTIFTEETYVEYAWSTGTFEPSVEVTEAGIYELSVVDINGCNGSVTFEIESLEMIVPVISTDPNICPGGTKTLETNESYADYLWSTGSNSASIEVNASGEYSLTVTDGNGCIGMTTINIETIAITPPAISGDPAICPGGVNTLSTNNGYVAYLWSTNSTAQSIEVDQPGTYGVTVTDANACTSSGFFIVEESELLSISIEGTLDICPGEMTTLSVANEYENYAWSNNVFAQSNEISQSGFYSLTVTDESGCTGVDIVAVIENEIPEPMIEGNTVLCEGTSGLLSVENIYTSITWSNGFTSPLSPVNTSGTYSVSVTNDENCIGVDEITVTEATAENTIETANICYGEVYNGTAYFESTQITNESTSYQGCDSTHTIQINVASAINLNLNGSGGCGFGGTIDATVSGNVNNYTYEWSNGASTSDLANLNSGTYTLTVTNEFGCSEIASETLTLATPPSANLSANTVVCLGDMNGEIDLEITNGTPPFNINWSNGMTGTHLEGLSGGTYTVVISDANGCNLFSSVTIPQPSKLYAGFDGMSATNGSNGSAAANVSGGVQPYSYEWSTGANTNVITGLSNGEYSLTVTDANGCTSVYVGDLNSVITGIEDVEHLLSLELFPNPSDGRFVVSMELSRSDDVELEIFDILGKKVKNAKQSGQEIYFHMDMQDLAQGSYFVIVHFSEGYLTRKIIIAK